MLEKGEPFRNIKQRVQMDDRATNYVTARYPKGRTLMHIAALHNRVDVMRWLVADYRMDVRNVDHFGDTVLSLTQKSGSSDAELFIKQQIGGRVVACFVYRHHHHQKYLQFKRKCIQAAIRIQCSVRRHQAYRQYAPFLRAKRGSWDRFVSVWGHVTNLLAAKSELKPFSWSDVKAENDFLAATMAENVVASDDTQELIGNVATVVFDGCSSETQHNADGDNGYVGDGPDDRQDTTVPSDRSSVAAAFPTAGAVVPSDNIELSQSAVKWLNSADNKYRTLLQKKLTRLADGDRSYAMSKQLKGCDYPIYESKLDSAQRIIWTEVQRGSSKSILVWFISKHDDVSHFARHIDKSFSRLSLQPTISTTTEASQGLQILLGADDVLLDPVGNCPLKIYTATRGEIPLLSTAGWTPPLRLGAKQQEVQEMSNTVLLLGRSGTGKTVCLSDRMSRDRDIARVTSGVTLSQLFVSRSKRLCEFVKYYQHQHTVDKFELESVDFMTLDKFVSHMERTVNSQHATAHAKFYSTSRRVDFHRFSALMAAVVKKSGLDAIVIWTQIRSFIKGSIEAVMQRGAVSLAQYLDTTVFGLERCRLSQAQREQAYAVYLQYVEVLLADGLWDDAGRVMDLLTRSKLEPLSACNGQGADFHKVYVDEVQDNTQAEIVLYFLAAGMNTQALFLAGDPAQSVVEGVDFRFEDVRSIVYTLSGGTQSISRPIKLFVNYRSHSGILDCAAAVLDKMFTMFPGSAKVLPRDAGLFKGPRPAFCSVHGADSLVSVLRQSQRIIVICPDERVTEVESLVSDAGLVNLVLGIRAAKGLEFQDIVLYDFFSSIPAADHKAWKSLLSDSQSDCKPYSHPQIESQLKLLYTAITRSCNRLIFVESRNSPMVSVFFRWLKSQDMAESFKPAATDGSEETQFMTSDEWRVQGIEFALSAEGDSTEMFLEKAVQCFTLANDSALRAQCQLQLDIERYRKYLLQALDSSYDNCMKPKDELAVAVLVGKGLSAGQIEAVKELTSLLVGRVEEDLYFRQNVLKQLQLCVLGAMSVFVVNV